MTAIEGQESVRTHLTSALLSGGTAGLGLAAIFNASAAAGTAGIAWTPLLALCVVLVPFFSIIALGDLYEAFRAWMQAPASNGKTTPESGKPRR